MSSDIDPAELDRQIAEIMAEDSGLKPSPYLLPRRERRDKISIKPLQPKRVRSDVRRARNKAARKNRKAGRK